MKNGIFFFLKAAQIDTISLLFYKHIFAIMSKNQLKVPDLVVISEKSSSQKKKKKRKERKEKRKGRDIQFFSI